MSLAALVKGRGPSGYGYGTTAEEVTAGLDLSGRTFLVTGVNSGLGLETTRVLSLRGAHVVALARTKESAASALASVGAKGTPVACDLSEPESVRAAVEEVKKGAPLDAMVCNAGVMALPKRHVKHGLELQFLTNHVGHFLLVTGLLDRLNEPGRVVVLSSAAHRYAPREGIRLDDLGASRGYNGWVAYGQSKLANILFARALAKRLGGEGAARTANSLHPGVIKTNLGRHMGFAVQIGYALGGPLVLKSIPQGASTQCYVATHPTLAKVSAKYFADCNVARPSRLAEDDALAEALWEKTEEIARRV
jgi:NAD(P)-dependent dehydrogenase (short-subunit alcohol dehydrogenase family)